MLPAELKEWRQKLDLTQEEAAKIFGVSRVTEQNWERGLTSVPGHVEHLLRRRLNYGPVILYYRTEPATGLTLGKALTQRFLNNDMALLRCCNSWGKSDFFDPFIMDEFGNVTWPGPLLKQEIERRLASYSDKRTPEEIETRKRNILEFARRFRENADLSQLLTDDDLYDENGLPK